MTGRIRIFTSRALYSRALIFACIGYIAGIAFNYIFSFSEIFIPVIFSLLFFATVFFIGEEKQILTFCISIFFLFCAAGIWYGGIRMNTQFDNSHVGFFSSIKGTKATIAGFVARAPEESPKNTKLIVDTRAILLSSGESYAVQGLTQAFLPPGSAIQEGQNVVLAGVLQKPENFSGFDYQSYLASQGIEALLMNAKIQSAQSPPASMTSSLHGGLSKLRLSAKNLLTHFIPGAEGEIVAATTLGYGNEISQSLSDTLSRAGVRYLMAISGLHIMIIANLFIGLMLLWGFARRTALSASFVVIFLFGSLIAFPLPALRAIVMAGVFYAGQFLGRPLNIFRTLLYVASAMLAINPLLFADVGFQLSFGGFLGILLFAPFFEKVLRKLFLGIATDGEKNIRGKIYAAFDGTRVFELLAMSISATLFTFPLALFHFGIVSLWGIVMSMIAIPFLGPLFVLTCALLIFSSIASSLGAIAAFPLWVGLHLFLQAARFFSSLSFFIFSTDPYNPVLLAGSYGALAIFFFVIIRRGYNPLKASIRFFRLDEG